MGLMIGLTLVKFGNPVVLDYLVIKPANFGELFATAWPLAWGYAFALAALVICRVIWRPALVAPPPLCAVAIGWFGWQLIAAQSSVSPEMSRTVVVHFGFAMLFLFSGFAMGTRTPWKWIAAGIAPGFLWMMLVGLDQHYGGFEATRKAFFEQPDWQTYPKEYLLRIQTNRVFATLVYPNALAGVILLFAPLLALNLHTVSRTWSNIPRGVIVGGLILATAGLFYWTGSKAGWLIALVLGVVVVLRLESFKRWRWWLGGAIIVLGLLAFVVRFQGYLSKGATSASARMIYWKTAWELTKENPVHGTGPGTFGKLYSERKPPEAEMARLVHNDYLEQASDSGWPGFALYAIFVIGSLFSLGKWVWAHPDPTFFCVWLGLLGFALQGTAEFGLYIPALAWGWFFMMGCLWACRRVESGKEPEPQVKPSARGS